MYMYEDISEQGDDGMINTWRQDKAILMKPCSMSGMSAIICILDAHSNFSNFPELASVVDRLIALLLALHAVG